MTLLELIWELLTHVSLLWRERWGPRVKTVPVLFSCLSHLTSWIWNQNDCRTPRSSRMLKGQEQHHLLFQPRHHHLEPWQFCMAPSSSLSVYVVIKAAPNHPLRSKESILGICYCLALGWSPNKAFTLLIKSNNRWCCSCPFSILDDLWVLQSFDCRFD